MNRFRCQVCMCYPWRLETTPKLVEMNIVVQMNIRIPLATKSSDHETFFKRELLLRC